MPITAEIRALARLLLRGEWDRESMRQRVQTQLGKCPRVFASAIAKVLRQHPPGRRPTLEAVTAVLSVNDSLRTALSRQRPRLYERLLTEPLHEARWRWPVHRLESAGELADWLEVDPNDLLWFADPGEWLRRGASQALRHYRWQWIPKRTGGYRLLEAPKPRLARIQRRILDGILQSIPVHECAHGFVVGRNTLSHVEPHTGKATVLRLDLADFFPSISRARVDAIFRHAGYPVAVARLLACLCTTSTPSGILAGCPAGASNRIRQLHRMPHLPQGSPASPALANLSAFPLDCRLRGYAEAAGANYTRYADDLLLSGGPELRRAADALLTRIGAIVMEEGFEVNWRKVRLQTQSVSQRAVGLVLNEKPAVPREQYDQLKAILCNIGRHGSASQNRDGHADFEAHLRGRIAHIAHIQPARGARLKALFKAIPSERWECAPTAVRSSSGTSSPPVPGS
jgi:RNA-directed DNA polymerase